MEYSKGRQFTWSRRVILLALLLAVFAFPTVLTLLANGKFKSLSAGPSLPGKEEYPWGPRSFLPGHTSVLTAQEGERLTLSATAAASALYAPRLTARATEWGVELSWKAVAGAERYELMTWWDEETGWLSIDSDDLTGATYMHTSVRTWTTYFYTIRAVNAAGETSGWWAKFPSARVRPVVTVTTLDKPMSATAGRCALTELKRRPTAQTGAQLLLLTGR